MAQRVNEENPVPHVLTGGDNRDNQLFGQLCASMANARGIDIIVSFLMESGVRMLLSELASAIERGVRIRILTGDYLGITSPTALYLLKGALGDRAELRLYSDRTRAFHPKAYLFHSNADMDEIYIGSSNLSRSALTSGIEWNYRVDSRVDPAGASRFCEEFERLFYAHSIELTDGELARYAHSWHQPSVYNDIEACSPAISVTADSLHEPQPRGPQIEALYALNALRAEGISTALVHAATGIGKTYLAAFDSRSYRKLLFVAHRHEILEQAAAAFSNVRGSGQTLGFFDGTRHDSDADIMFASVATLGQKCYLRPDLFQRDQFDYIIIDEFHHAVCDNYRRIMDYFTPQFLLGLTATPERLDGRNIYELCDYNVAYELPLRDAINRGVLVPFQYYGIYDSTDYSHIEYSTGRYDERQLTDAYLRSPERTDLIFRRYEVAGSKYALGFCCSVRHAQEMAEAFTSRGVPAVSVCSRSGGRMDEDRTCAIKRLQSGDIRVIFTVDMFNEGVDIPELDTVMFLRPTESPVVFLQQLGRGLRTFPEKKHLTVLDFIGNYVQASRVPQLLGDIIGLSSMTAEDLPHADLPDGCQMTFDLKLIDLFKYMERRTIGVREQIEREYRSVKQRLGRIPSRIDLFANMRSPIYDLCMRNAGLNPFRHYLDFLHDMGDGADTDHLLDGIGYEFIRILETTRMTKSYKMAVLRAFCSEDHLRMELSDEDILRSWKAFYDYGQNWKDCGASPASRAEYEAYDDAWHVKLAKKMPVRHLIASGGGFFVEKESAVLALREELEPWIHDRAFVRQFQDVLRYRTAEYYRRRYEDGHK